MSAEVQRKRRRIVLILALVPASLFILLLLVVFLWDPIAEWRLAARIRALREAGEPVRIEDLDALYPEPPPGENAATLFERAFVEMAGNRDIALENELPVAGPNKVRPPVEFVPSAWLDRIRSLLARNQRALELLHEAVACGGCKFDIDFPTAVVWRPAHLVPMRRAAWLLMLEAIERTERGEEEAAARSLWACLRVGRALGCEPLLLSWFYRADCDAFAVEQLERWVSRLRPSPRSLERLEAALQAETDPAGLDRVFLVERCCFINVRKQLKPRMLRRRTLADALGVKGKVVDRTLGKVRLPLGSLATQKRHLIDILNDSLAALGAPYPRRLQQGVRAAEAHMASIPKRRVVCRGYASSVAWFFRKRRRHVAGLEAARMALAALRHRAKHGGLPATLQDLVPDFVDSVPLDPFDGKPLRYRKTKDGFVIYAIGENAKDDGGKTESDPSTAERLDIGFRVRWPKARF